MLSAQFKFKQYHFVFADKNILELLCTIKVLLSIEDWSVLYEFITTFKNAGFKETLRYFP